MTSVLLSPELKAIRAGRSPRALTGGSFAGLWSVAPVASFNLRRSGMRPLKFSGMLLAEHAVEDEGFERRHAVRLYETVDGFFVLEIVLSAANSDVLPHALVEDVGTLGEIETFLSEYDPAAQAPMTIDATTECGAFSLSATAEALAREAARLREDFETARAAVFAAAGSSLNDDSQRAH